MNAQAVIEPVEDEATYQKAVALVRESERASTSFIQKSLAIGYNAAARLVERMEREGVVSKACPFGKRDVLPPALGDLGAMQAADRKAANKPPMKNTPEDQAVSDLAYGIVAGELRQFIEQYEQLDAEKSDVSERQKELMAEAKARGYDTKVMRKVVAMRKRDKDDLAEEEAILDMYKAAMGMG